MGFKSTTFHVAMTCEVEGTRVELKLISVLLNRQKQSECFIGQFIKVLSVPVLETVQHGVCPISFASLRSRSKTSGAIGPYVPLLSAAWYNNNWPKRVFDRQLQQI